MYSWQTPDPYAFKYTTTEHECPECKTLLTQPELSTMLVCNEGHGPYFLV